MALLTPETVYRRYETDGVPDSGDHKPIKAEIIQLLNMLFGMSRGGWVVARTLAELNGITPESETDGGLVLTGAGSGYYDRDAGAWVFGRGFPDTFAKVTLSGSSAAQTGVVNAGVNPASIEVFFAKVVTANTGALTLSISGEAAKPVVNLAGNQLSAGEWTGMVVFYLNDANQYQLLIDAGAAASAAASASAADADRIAAEAAAAAALGAVSGLSASKATVALAEADTPDVDPEYYDIAYYDSSYVAGSGGKYRKVASDPGHPFAFQNGNDTWYENAELIIRPEMIGTPLTGVAAREGLQAALDFAVGKVCILSKNYSTPLIPVEEAGDGLPAVALKMPGNSHIVWENGCKIELPEHWEITYRILSLDTVSDITLVNPYVDGRRDLNTTLNPVDDGRQGNGIGIHCAGTGANIKIYNPRTDNCTAEGIIVGYSFANGATKHWSDDVYIENHRADNNRRQGMAIISAIKCIVVNPEWTNTNGCAPEAGIDIEPDNSGGGKCRLDFIRIINPRTKGNAGAGVLMYLNSIAEDPGGDFIDIQVVGHQSEGDLLSVWIDRVVTNPLKGSIVYDDLFSVDARQSVAAVTSIREDGPCIVFNRPRGLNPNRDGITFEGFGSPFRVTRQAGDPATNPMGNVHFINPSVEITSGTIPQLATFNDYAANSPVTNVSFMDPVSIELGPDNGSSAKAIVFFGTGKISDTHEQLVFEVSGAYSMGRFAYPARLLLNNAAFDAAFLPPSTPKGAPDITVEIKNAVAGRVAPPSGGRFLELTTDQAYQTTQAGAYIKARPLGGNVWAVVEKVGTWTVV